MRNSGPQDTNLGFLRGGEWGDQVMSIKEGTCCDEPWLSYATNELLNTTSKTNDGLYAG